MLSEIYSFIFLETEKSKIRVLQPKVQAHVDALLHHIKVHLGIASRVSVPCNAEEIDTHDIRLGFCRRDGYINLRQEQEDRVRAA